MLQRKYDNYLRNVLRKNGVDQLEVDDVLQQTWMKFVQKGRFIKASVRGWLGTIGMNELRNIQRSKKVRSKHIVSMPKSKDEEGDVLDIRDRNMAQPGRVSAADKIQLMHDKMMEALGTMEGLNRDVLTLRLEGRSPTDIAEILHKTPVAIYNRLSKAREELRKKVGDDYLGETFWMDIGETAA